VKKRILSIIMALSCLLSIAVVPVEASDSADSGNYGWPEMEGDIAMRVTQNGGEVTRLIVGETYTLQFWLQNIGPYSIALPVAWDPSVVTVINPQTGKAVESGRKQAGDASGFHAGSKCYESGWDPWTYEPLYWNGKPVYSLNEEEGGYSYLDQEAGSYRFFYYVDSPNTPQEAQLFLEINFKVIGKGDPDFHIATSADGDGRYDPAEPDGLAVVVPGGDDGAQEIVYGTSVTCPSLRVLTASEAEEEASKPIDWDALLQSSPGYSSLGETEEAEIVQEATLTEAKHLTCFPYTTASETAAVLKQSDGKITQDSDYILPTSLISDAVNQNDGTKRSLLVKMPDEIIEKSEYALVFSMTNVDDMYRSGMTMLYVETPWAYVGLNTGILTAQTSDSATVRLQVRPYGNGVRLVLEVDGTVVKGFTGLALRVILPYEPSTYAESGQEGDEVGYDDDSALLVIPVGQDVFGTGKQTGQPMSLSKVDETNGAVIFLASSFCAYTVESSPAQTFTDLKSVTWAEESIEALAQRLVVNGVGGGKFNPNGNVTREQFAKMLVCALGMYTATGTSSFTDVEAGAYYAPFVNSAYAAGLANGYGAAFGVGDSITRQDLAVMAYRAMQQLGVSMPVVRNAAEFNDQSSISDYAQEAVSALYSAGILDGVGNNTFNPKGTATRAQAAKIVWGVMQLTEGLL
jgi:hypothetical protein